MLKKGDRVFCNSFLYKGNGTVIYIDSKNLYNHHLLPIQVELDEGDAEGHRIKRFSLKEIVKEGEKHV